MKLPTFGRLEFLRSTGAPLWTMYLQLDKGYIQSDSGDSLERAQGHSESRQARRVLALADAFDWLNEPIQPARTTRGEARFKILAQHDDRVFAAIFTIRGEDIHVISLRPASRRERRTYAERITARGAR